MRPLSELFVLDISSNDDNQDLTVMINGSPAVKLIEVVPGVDLTNSVGYVLLNVFSELYWYSIETQNAYTITFKPFKDLAYGALIHLIEDACNVTSFYKFWMDVRTFSTKMDTDGTFSILVDGVACGNKHVLAYSLDYVDDEEMAFNLRHCEFVLGPGNWMAAEKTFLTAFKALSLDDEKRIDLERFLETMSTALRQNISENMDGFVRQYRKYFK